MGGGGGGGEEEQTVWREENGRRRRRGRGREEEVQARPKRYVTNLGMNSSMELYGFVWISCLDMCLWVVGCRKPNPIMNLCIEIITNPFVSLGFCYEMT